MAGFPNLCGAGRQRAAVDSALPRMPKFGDSRRRSIRFTFSQRFTVGDLPIPADSKTASASTMTAPGVKTLLTLTQDVFNYPFPK